MIELVLGFSLGLVSSLHCVGMCGPLILSIPKPKFTIHNFLYNKSIYNPIAYNIGRILTYVFIGIIVGIFGELIKITFLHQQISIFAGGLMLVTGIATKFEANNIIKSKILNNIFSKLKAQISALLNAQTTSKMFLLGVLNGFLPCGMVYMAILSSLAWGDIKSTAVYMGSFGLGTSPLLISFFFFSGFVSNKLKLKSQKLIPIVTIVIGLIVVFRGMGLGIPYLSPDLDKKTELMQKQQTNKQLSETPGGICY